MKAESLISNEHRCYICGTTTDIHCHHIFYGTANRKQSDKYGCWIYLCAYHHNMSDKGIHFNRELDLKIKKLCQEKWEAEYGNREQFRSVFGKSYL